MVSGLGVVIERIGLFAALKYRAAKLLRLPCVSLPIRGHSVAVRPRTHDLRVALTSLGREFDRLRSLLDPDFDGIIVDAGGYIGSAALRLSDLFPAATIVSIEPRRRPLKSCAATWRMLNGSNRSSARLRP